MPSLLNAPTFKLSDRREILERILTRLHDSPECRWDFKGIWKRMTIQEEANWDARLIITRVLAEFPNPRLTPVEPEHVEPIAEPTV